MLDLSGYDMKIGCIAIRKVLTAEWRNFRDNLYIKIGSEDNYKDIVKYMAQIFVPPLTDNVQYNDQDMFCDQEMTSRYGSYIKHN